jgi:hypothetical protein
MTDDKGRPIEDKQQTLAAVFIRARGNSHSTICDWIAARWQRQICAICQIRENGGEPICQDSALSLVNAATLSGFYDFLLVLHVNDLHTIEDFVISCVRGSLIKDDVELTQTLVGSRMTGLQA